MKPAQLIAIGIGLIFIAPSLLGLLVSHFAGWFAGVGVGLVWFLAVVGIGYRKIMQQTKDKEVK